MQEPDYRIEVTNQQRYVLYLTDAGSIYKLDTWTGDTWALAETLIGEQYWKPFVDNAHASEGASQWLKRLLPIMRSR